ncbi:MAG: cobalamin biosynthesis protein [Bacillus subtilis]|nr:cobalamin biosynthesis protein [Bacillus subtilis]
MIELAQYYNKKLEFFDENDINNLENHFSQSKAQDYFNIKGVAEPCAVLASNLKTLFVNKQIYKNTTFAAAFLKEKICIQASYTLFQREWVIQVN